MQAPKAPQTRAAAVKAEPDELSMGENITGQLDGNILTLKIDISKRLRPSSTKVTTIVATTGGNQPVGSTKVLIGVNAYVKNPKS